MVKTKRGAGVGWGQRGARFNLKVRANGLHMVLVAADEPSRVPRSANQRHQAGTRQTSRFALPTSRLAFLPSLCLQTSDWVGFQDGCKILNCRHARFAPQPKAIRWFVSVSN